MPFVYNPGVPTGTVDLNVDYLNLQGNFQQANIVYGTDHYPFDNATPNQGFHNLVTTPPFVDNPPTGLPPVTVANPKFYAFQQYAALGVLQYSRGPNNAVPTPLTSLNAGPFSLNALVGFTSVIDFSGFTRVMAILSAFNDTNLTGKASFSTFIAFSQGTFNIASTGTPSVLSAGSIGTVLIVRNNSSSNLTNVYWALQFIRIE